ncbi:MAG: M23 family metallopeptidase [candidate division Zixibacteria bacterium]|nr:M23 family metallopeptidase [candidate division Zixibacteria bacterium]
MTPRKISLLLIPPDTSKVKNLSISTNLIYSILGILVLFFAVSIFWGVSFFKNEFDQTQLKSLKTENEFLVQRLSEMVEVVDGVKANLSQIVQQDDNIRMAFDIPKVNPETRQLGTGGTFENEIAPVREEVARNLHILQDEIQMLQRTAEFENSSYAAILDAVVSKKFLLDHTPSIKPCDGYFASGFGNRPDPFTGQIHLHAGVDLAADKGTPVMVTADGVVKYTGWAGRLGKIIRIDHDFGYETLYGHLAEINVRKGHKVTRGQIIGTMGSTGRSTGPHLHYEVHQNRKAINPMNFIFSDYKNLF